MNATLNTHGSTMRPNSGNMQAEVLEVGCGTGADLLQFAKHGAIATGVDLTERHLDLARRRVGSLATVLKADMRQLPFENGTFDYVYSHGVIHHSDEPEKVAREILRVLRPGGRFNVQVYSLFSYCTLWSRMIVGRNWKLEIENSKTPVHIDLYTARMLRRLFPGVKLRIVKRELQGRLHFLEHWFGWFLIATGCKTLGQ